MEKALALTIFFTLALGIYGCTSVRYSKMVPTQPLPSNYSLNSNTPNPPPTNIDTTHIYAYEDDLVRSYQGGKAELVHTYMFIKFNGNGTGFRSADSRTPITPLNVEGIGGEHFYYKVKGDDLKIETFDAIAKKFVIWHGKIYEDHIHFYRQKLRVFTGGVQKLDINYRKKMVKYPSPLVWPE